MVDVGEVPRLQTAVGPTGASKHAERIGDTLFKVDADARPARIGAHGIDVGGQAGRRSQRDCVGIRAHATTFQVPRDLDLARLPPQLMPLLKFSYYLEIREIRIELSA